MGLVAEQDHFLTDVARLVAYAKDLGFTVTGGELYRTPQQQAIYMREGRSRTLASQHLRRLAVDLNFFVSRGGRLELCYDRAILQPLGDYWESLAPGLNRWGGNWTTFKDTPHFERRPRRSVPETAQPADTPTQAAAEVTASSGTDPRASRLIAAPVGSKRPNHRDDVKTIQILLNALASGNGFRMPEALKADGIFGPMTQAAILSCQHSAVGLSAPDGVVDPGGRTMRVLCRLVPSAYGEMLLQLVMLNAAEADVARFAAPISAAFKRYEIDTALRQAHFLAQIGHESGELRFSEEIASGSAYEGRTDLGNVEHGDGARFKGRGLIQLTGRYNYTKFGAALGREEEILADPAVVATDLALCVGAAGWYWDGHGLNALADDDDIRGITRRINGGYNGIAHRQALLGRAKALYGLI
ncbi:MAG: M15 family metallopeptidase [Rhodobacteraceae bacterium]|nr:M15 family metallopeptidase [Paracoccaceae bacterium]